MMANKQLKGKHFRVDGNTVRFFDAKGTTLKDGKWGINAPGGKRWLEIEPCSLMPRIRKCIQQAINNGHEPEIAQLQLGARRAVTLFLEGYLTRQNLKHAIAGDSYIDVPNVNIDGYTLTVRVMANPNFGFAAADSDGSIL